MFVDVIVIRNRKVNFWFDEIFIYEKKIYIEYNKFCFCILLEFNFYEGKVMVVV